MKIFRQGDVLIWEAPKGVAVKGEVPRDNGSVILAYGELTGHAHRIRAQEVTMYETAEERDAAEMLGTRLLRVNTPEGVKLTHEEHATINIPEGDWYVRIQREYSPGALRNVAD